MSKGVPGYDFEANEMVTAQKLRLWLERATWEDLSYSETTGLLGVRVGDEFDPGASEGQLLYSPRLQKFFIRTRHGWVGVLNPTHWETVRFRPSNPMAPSTRDFVRISGPAGGNTPLSEGNRNIFELGGPGRSFLLPGHTSENTLATSTHYPLVGWGLCLGFKPATPDLVALDRLGLPITTTTGSPLSKFILAWAGGNTLSPAVSGYGATFLLGVLRMDLFK